MKKREVDANVQQLIWLPTGGHVGDAIMIVALFAEAIEKAPGLRVLYVMRRNAAAAVELARAYPAVTVVPLPYAPLPAIKTVLNLLTKRSVVIVPPPRVVHPMLIKILSALFVLRGDTVIGFRDRERDHSRWHPYRASVVYDHDARYIDNLRRALALASLPTQPLGSAPRLQIISALPKDFPFKDKPYFVIHAFANMTMSKSLPLRRWKGLVQKLRQEYPLYGIVITGVSADRAQAEELAAVLAADVYLSIDRPLYEVAGLIKEAKLYIGIDTGPTHLAGVLGAPSVVLAKRDDPAWLPDYNPNAILLSDEKDCLCGTQGPGGKRGAKCLIWEDGKAYRRCVYGITDEAILSAIRGIL